MLLLLNYYREFYDTGALMLNDEATVVAGLLVGLNIIDCNMVLKDDGDLDRPVRRTYLMYIITY